jgi:hypothetical protein
MSCLPPPSDLTTSNTLERSHGRIAALSAIAVMEQGSIVAPRVCSGRELPRFGGVDAISYRCLLLRIETMYSYERRAEG